MREKGVQHNIFQPTFGNRPNQFIGRDGEVENFMTGLAEPIGSRNRCTLFLGQRGMGKTALLLELGDRAAKAGYVVARVTAHEGMSRAIVEQIQLNGSQYFKGDKKRLTGINAAKAISPPRNASTTVCSSSDNSRNKDVCTGRADGMFQFIMSSSSAPDVTIAAMFLRISSWHPS